MTPYLEVRMLARDPRRMFLVIAAGALLVVPFGAFLPGSEAGFVGRTLAVLAFVIVAPILGVAVGRPRQLITVDGESAEITRQTTGRLPDPRAHTERWPIATVRVAELEELGTPHEPRWGVQIHFVDGETLHLNAYADVDLAQDTLDHLALLGVPAHSRASEREASYAQRPPETWL